MTDSTTIDLNAVPLNAVPLTTSKHQVAVIGAGPAGWTAALYLGRAGLAPLVFEGELDGTILPGGQLTTTTEVENYPGFPNGGISGWDMVELFKKQGEEFGAITLGETVKQVKVVDDNSNDDSNDKVFFEILTKDKTYRVRSVVIATGATAKYLGLPSEQQWLTKLNKQWQYAPIKQWQQTSVAQWADESLQLVREANLGYCHINSKGVCNMSTKEQSAHLYTPAYQAHYSALLQQRVLQAAASLNKLLEQAL